jgi:hypothetical protein
MVIFSGGCFGKKFEELKSRRLGIMISATTDPTLIKPQWATVPCSLDNGAYSDFRRGGDFPFDEYRFLSSISTCIKNGINLDFIVLPDRVAQGKKSLDFSIRWLERLSWGRFALALQDGVEESDIPIHREEITTLFVGGTRRWKWKNAKRWIDFAHANGKKCHIGQVGRLSHILEAERLGADSIDSTSFSRNDSWHILDEFSNATQLTLEV